MFCLFGGVRYIPQSTRAKVTSNSEFNSRFHFDFIPPGFVFGSAFAHIIRFECYTLLAFEMCAKNRLCDAISPVTQPKPSSCRLWIYARGENVYGEIVAFHWRRIQCGYIAAPTWSFVYSCGTFYIDSFNSYKFNVCLYTSFTKKTVIQEGCPPFIHDVWKW